MATFLWPQAEVLLNCIKLCSVVVSYRPPIRNIETEVMKIMKYSFTNLKLSSSIMSVTTLHVNVMMDDRNTWQTINQDKIIDKPSNGEKKAL